MSEIILDDKAFIVSETDKTGKIIYANNDFEKYSGFSIDELIGKPHNLVRHEDMPKAAFKDLWDTVKSGQTWSGFVKNKTKTGNYYWVFATVAPMITINGEEGYISCRIRATRQEIETHDELYAKMRAGE